MVNKNKTLLVVLGVFALVIVTTAASFAFFTYSRVGNTTTTITSGDIEFTYKEGDNASLPNAFPVSDSVGAQDTTGEYTFDVKMTSSSSSNKMEYNVYLLDNNSDTSKNYFTNEQIKFALVKDGTYVAGTSATEGKALTDISGFVSGEHEGEGLVLQEQEITSGETDTYKLRIWISDDVNYSNTIDENGTMTGKYNGYTYSLKVKVTSGAISTTTKLRSLTEEYGFITAEVEDPNGVTHYAVSENSNSPQDNEWIEITSDGTAKSNVLRTASNLITKKTITHQVEKAGTYYLYVKNTNDEILKEKIIVATVEWMDNSGAAYPEIKGDLVPVKISNTGVVTKANIHQEWYDYDESVWANAVILTDNAPELEAGDTIEEQYIESYFVWIPRYKYKIFDEGKYTSLASKTAAEQPIVIEFETKTTAASTGTSEGTWLTHPAFTTLDVNGIWVGKFESGYNGATTTAAAQQNVADKTKLIIKPNVYSWRNITVGNAFKTSYEYNRDLDSHMMKNTEWGAVAYLSHSEYGNLGETGNGFSLRINNNSAYITGYSGVEEPTVGYNKGTSREGNRVESTAIGADGTYTVNYLNTNSVVSSTTGNYSGVYDMSGGAWEYVMGYTTGASTVGGASTITTLYPKFFDTDSEYTKYYDKYTSTAITNFSNRILGDATGEMGTFFSETDPDGSARNKSSWYGDYANFAIDSNPWFGRGGYWSYGTVSGAFAFYNGVGGAYATLSFRVVLAPSFPE